MNYPNEIIVSDWLESSEILDEIKEESVEIKEEPLDDISYIKQEDLIDHPSDNVKEELEEFKEDFGDFAYIKQKEPILDFEAFHAIEKGPLEIKEEDSIDDFDDTKEEELVCIPIADVFCPSTGDSRPLTIDIDNGIHTRRQIAPYRNSLIMAPNTNTLNKAVGVNRLLTVCDFCDSFYLMGTEMNTHVRSKHSEELEKMFQEKGLTKCAFCWSFYEIGTLMTNHVRSAHPNELEISTRQMCNDIVRSGAKKKKLDGNQSDCPPAKVARRAQICNLCGKQASPCILSPQDPTSAQRFFDNLIELTPKQLETAQFFVSRHVQVTICLSHLKDSERDCLLVELLNRDEQQTGARGNGSKGVRPTNDEQLAAEKDLPITAAEIENLSSSDYKNLIKTDSLTEPQRQLIGKIRRRGQNKVSKLVCRERREHARTEKMSGEVNDHLLDIVE